MPTKKNRIGMGTMDTMPDVSQTMIPHKATKEKSLKTKVKEVFQSEEETKKKAMLRNKARNPTYYT